VAMGTDKDGGWEVLNNDDCSIFLPGFINEQTRT
jgi:hypothetical protein